MACCVLFASSIVVVTKRKADAVAVAEHISSEKKTRTVSEDEKRAKEETGEEKVEKREWYFEIAYSDPTHRRPGKTLLPSPPRFESWCQQADSWTMNRISAAYQNLQLQGRVRARTTRAHVHVCDPVVYLQSR